MICGGVGHQSEICLDLFGAFKPCLSSDECSKTLRCKVVGKVRHNLAKKAGEEKQLLEKIGKVEKEGNQEEKWEDGLDDKTRRVD